MRKPDPVEIVAVTVPLLAQAVVVTMMIGLLILLANVIADHEPLTCRAGSLAAMFTSCEVIQ